MSSGGALPHQLPSRTDGDEPKAKLTDTFKGNVGAFRSVVTAGGEFPPEKDRYHLYVSYTCPFATRTLIARQLKGLEEIIPVTVLSPRVQGSNVWAFASVDPYPGAERDPLYNSDYLKDLYLRADPAYTGKFTVPVFWDKKKETIVSNESAEIVRMFNSAFNELLSEEKASVDLYPESLRPEIDEMNNWVFDKLNIGVYKAGFAKSQEIYDAAVPEVFKALDVLEARLTGKEFLVGDRLTEADVRLFVTIVRFDPVYFGLFKCNVRDIRHGYPAIDLWLRKLYWTKPAFGDTCNFDHIKTGYYSAPHLNPHQIVPVGPEPAILPLQ